ncbi:TMV resistance protein N-like isoform X3 [Prunus avium]|uniref:TMV resistance protein N-like isoform X3 n=1 Tax=Prunus avium TaxID=42229 RepID=A0A6P5U6Q5_PRUAV|nr:TMV resistance protein N-like isoform X3 [Prunus avium]
MFKFLFRFMGSWVTPPLPIDFGKPQLPSDLPPMTTQPVFSSSSSFSYEVFLSFRGEDTRTNFTDHLYKALCDKGIYTFIDRELVRGEEISPALVKAIEESRISLIVFSENYASSRWCLDELVKILQCKQSNQQIVLPIFYKVDPSDVRHQRSSYGDAFVHHESKFKDDKQKVLKWRRALKEAANLSGWHFKEGHYEATFINNIVDGILSRVPTYWNVAKYPVGIQSHVQDVKKLLDVGGNGHRMVGIWGTSGIGKTTIAKAIRNAIAHEFEGSCFLPNVREGSLVQLQETLLDKILGKNLKIGNVDEGIGVIKERLRHKKILLILDDVDQLEQLENLAGDDWFGDGSRVIITTKNRRLLNNREIELIYEVKKLDCNQALELFSWHAFRRSEPPKDYLKLAQRAIAFADGLPLALKILGSHLRGTDIRLWQDTLNGYEGEPYTHIERILQKSYDALDHRAKEYFLDIACFFKGEYEDYVLRIVPKIFIEEFVDKALITIEGRMILMHDLLANLGKDIVHKESPNDPGQRSRLWFYEDVIQVLMESTGTRNIKGIMVKLPKAAKITLNPECFRNMVNLKIFINHNASLCGDINYLPNVLRWIDWDGYQLQSLPPNFQGNHLVKFKMSRSHIRQLEGFKHLPNLTHMNLSGCQFLEKIPDLSGIPNIKDLNLSGCTSLVEVDDSVGLLDKLVKLDLSECVKLTRFGTRLRLKSLEELDLRNCKRLESFPEIEVEMESLWRLNMQESGIRELPLSISYLTGLQSLNLSGCFNLTGFELRLLYCWSTLQELRLAGINFVTLPECISKFVSLNELDLCDCKYLLEIPQKVLPPSLDTVYLDDCTSLGKIPNLPSEVEDKYLSLINCVGLRGYDITENSILDQVSSHPDSQFQITLPGDEVPKWFSCCKDATLVKDEYSSKVVARCEVSFEIPPNLDWETLRLVLCVVVNKGNAYGVTESPLLKTGPGGAETSVHINRKKVQSTSYEGNMCQIIFEFWKMPTSVKILCGVHLLGHQVADVTVDRGQRQCLLPDAMAVDDDDDDDDDDDYDDDDDVAKMPCGVHLLGHQVADVTVDRGQRQCLLPDAMAVDDDIHDDQHQDNELLSLTLASKTSLGKRLCGSDFMALYDDHRANVGAQEAQWLTLFTEPADHPKRRHIDLNEEPRQ